VVALTGPLPTLIEWDAKLPTWDVLQREADRAQSILQPVLPREHRHAAVG
jgi:uncharacterized protein (UPF0276 family)